MDIPISLQRYLADGHWHTADDIEYATGIDPVSMRQIAGPNGDVIIGSGKGYKLLKHATRDEALRAYKSLMSRAYKIMTRAHKLLDAVA